MSTDQNTTDFDGVDLRRLISAWCDGAIEPSDFQRLQTTLAASQEARMMYLACIEIHSGVQGDSTAREYLESFVPPIPPLSGSGLSDGLSSSGLASGPLDPPHILKFQRFTGLFRRKGFWAAILLVGFAGWGITNWARLAHAPRPAILARVVEKSADCQWDLDHGGEAHDVPSDVLCSNETIRIRGGSMKLEYTNGTLVTLYGPAIYQMMSNTRARMLLGKVTAKVAEGAKGFSVLTPRATVVDLGTEFGINVTDIGSTDVVVFKGSVDVDFTSADEGSAKQRRLRTGEAVHLDAQGTESRIISINSEWFSDKSDVDPDHPPLIVAVRDNIQRESWNFYEIVHAGMEEDAKAFVDRESHEWNGITTAGMPAYLLGGDYVKTFNNDKVKNDIEIRVTLSRPAKLYVLFDDRIPAPPWLRQNFRNTGDHIGVDEGPFYSNGMWCADHQPGVGPGVSVDNTSSVWVREIKTPGTVRLGATEAPISGINMYGIVAVPLDGESQEQQK